MQQHVQTLQARLQRVQQGGPPAAVARQRARHKGLVRERLAALLDAQTTFLEIAPFAAFGQYDDAVPAAGMVCGIGQINGILCMLVANDATVKAGTYFPETIKKHLRAQAIALQNRLPCVYLVDSGGIFLPLQAQLFADQEHFGRIFYNQAHLSARGIAQLAVVLGMCTAGGAYVPAMADETIIVKDTGTIYLAGPPLVQAATGECVSAAELGGGAMHAQRSGVVDHLADNEAQALQLARQVVAQLAQANLASGGTAEVGRIVPSAPPEPPLYPIEELYGVLPHDGRQPYDVHEVLARLLDGSRWQAFKQLYGSTLVCGVGHILGYQVGIVANNGVLHSASALKGAHFVQLCNQRRIPLLFLQNTTGFMVGKAAEQGGIAKDGAKMVQAVATASVPKITLVIGASHGAGNYAMCGRGCLPHFLFTWPNARVSVMGAAQATAVMQQLQKVPETAANAALQAQYAQQADAYYGSSRLWDDGIIAPQQTRQVIALALSTCLSSPPGSAAAAPVYRM